MRATTTEIEYEIRRLFAPAACSCRRRRLELWARNEIREPPPPLSGCADVGGDAFLEEIWGALDEDSSGRVTFEECQAWLERKVTNQSLKRNLKNARTCSNINELLQQQDEWSVELLKIEINQIIQTVGMQPDDLVKAWDKNGDGQARQRRDAFQPHSFPQTAVHTQRSTRGLGAKFHLKHISSPSCTPCRSRSKSCCRR